VRASKAAPAAVISTGLFRPPVQSADRPNGSDDESL